MKKLVSRSICKSLKPTSCYFFSDIKSQIKSLRELTGAPILKCKLALTQFNGDFEKAKKHLYENNLATAAKKTERQTQIGLLSYYTNYVNFVAYSEIACETDFVLRNEKFQDFAEKIGEILPKLKANINLNNELSENLMKSDYQELWMDNQQLIAKIQENIKVNRIRTIKDKKSQILGVYMHQTYKDRVGKSLTYVMLSHEKGEALTDKEEDVLKEVAEDLAVHVFCRKPRYIDLPGIPKLVMDEYNKMVEESMDENIMKKPEKIINKIFMGKLTKMINEHLLMNQKLDDNDDSETVQQMLNSLEKYLGFKVNVHRFETITI